MPDPVVDYERLKAILAGPAAASLPASLRARMTADVQAHDQAMLTQRPDDTSAQPPPPAAVQTPPGAPIVATPSDVTQVTSPVSAAQHYQRGQQVASQQTSADELMSAMPKAAFQFAHDITLGLSPSPYSDDPTLKGSHFQALEPVTKIASGLTAMLVEGAGLMKGLSYAGRVPIVARGLEFLPSRLKEIGIGALVNGGLDALRADGVARNEDGSVSEQSWMDPSAKIAKPLIEMGVPERAALALGGGAVGAIMAPIMIGITSGFMQGRAKIARVLTPEIQQQIRESLAKAGVDITGTTDKYEAAKVFIKNFRKISLSGDMSSVMADQLSREQYLSNEIAQGIQDLHPPVPHNEAVIAAANKVPDWQSPVAVLKNGKEVPLLDHSYGRTHPSGNALMDMNQDFPVQAADINQIKHPDGTVLYDRMKTEDIQVDGRLMAGIFRNNPGGVNVVTDVRSPEALQVAQERLGLNLHTAIIPRPPELPNVSDIKVLSHSVFDPGPFDPSFDGPNTLGYKTRDVHRIVMDTPKGQVSVTAERVTPTTIEVNWIDGDNGPNAFGPKTAKKIGVKLLGEFPGATKIQGERVSGATVASDISSAYEKGQLPDNLRMAEYELPPTTHDILIARPNYQYPSVDEKGAISTVGKKINDRMSIMAKEAATSVTAPRTTEAFILANGEPIRGGLNTTAMVDKMNLQKPMVAGKERPDLALREAGKFVRLDMPEPNKLLIELPRTMTQEQFNAVGRAVDAVKFDEVTIRGVDGTEKVLATPIGGLIQDNIAQMVKPKSVGSSITPKMVSQFQRTGVFEGQAAVLPDGTAATILNKQGAAGYKVRESMTGQTMVIHPKNLTILPTSLTSELQPSNLFTSALPDAERNALAKLRYSIQQGWADPITKYRDFESFANTRGYMSNSLRGGKVELSKINEGGAEPIKFDNLKAATEWVRKDSGPMAELANDQVVNLLGPDRNLGFIGGGGAPPRFNETIPIDWKRMETTMSTLPTDRGVGFFEELRKPMMPLLRDLDERFGTQMHKTMLNYQSQQIAKQNFENLWFKGANGKLPNDVVPLQQIIKSAGPNADRELIFDWREADAGGKVELEKQMTPQELKAGKDLAHWFDNMYPAIGVDAPFVENYMPRYREWLQKGGTDFNTFLQSAGIDPLKPPKGVDFISDHIRNGLLDAYEKDPFKVAVQYLRMGSDNRYLSQVKNEAREMVRMIGSKNTGIAMPLANMLQAMGGYEFAEQRAMLNETFQSFLDKFPGQGSNKDKQNLADKMVNFFSGAVYSSTMGFRPSLALRNAKDVMVMAYPLYNGPRFYEALGRALTVSGKEEAMAARAIGSHGGMLTETVEEFASQLPPLLRNITDASTKLYEDADVFTRAATFHAAKAKAEDALETFSQKMQGVTDPKRIALLKANLLRDSKVYIHGSTIEDEFLRRAGISPDAAAQFAGKTASDMTNFLYGRGMQARWMRSTAGRFLGQFGSWSMWYLDYLSRMTNAVASGPNRLDALAMLGRHALVNAAIVATGKEVLNVDLSRWASYGALFYSGGPGWTIATGASTLWRGLGEQSSFGEDPLAKTRVTEGSKVIWNTLPSFVPFMFAGKDVMAMSKSYDGTELLAATLGTKPTQAYIRQRRLDILLGGSPPPFQSTSAALAGQLNSSVVDTGQQPVDIRTVGQGAVASAGGMQIPSRAQQTPGQGTPTQRPAMPNLVPAPTTVPRSIQYRQSGRSNGFPGETKPPEGY
jgi:hypothetical protein